MSNQEMAELYALAQDPDVAWMDWAICPETDPDAFFPGKGGSLRRVKAICDDCPVQFECLDYALSHPELEGVWGGIGEVERSRMRASISALAA